jgi:opacity protein-like surface antigen
MLQRIRVVVAFLCFAGVVPAQTRELGLTLGRISGPTRSLYGGSLDLSPGIALQANFGYRFALTGRVGWIAEVHGLANGLREILSRDATATRDVATAFVTPGLRLKFLHWKRVSPYVAAGAGYALYEQSLFRLDGAPNEAPRFTHRSAFQYGGGADFPVRRWIGGRLEIRDFYTGNPSFNVPARSSGQHNVVISGGFVLFFGRSE